MIYWQDLHQSELSVGVLYKLLALRNAVFIVEQQCPYQDVDGKDLVDENRHILGWKDGVLIACARILKNDNRPYSLTIGRVIVAHSARGKGVGYQLMAEALAACTRHWPGVAIKLSAQAHLQSFYAAFGFKPVTVPYEEDGIMHIGMANDVSA